MSTALSTIISDIKLQDADVVRAQLLARIKIAAGPLPSPCWLFVGNLGRYGSFQGQATHRLSWELQNDAIPAGLWVLHACDQTTLLQPSALSSRYTEDEHGRLCRQRPTPERQSRRKRSWRRY